MADTRSHRAGGREDIDLRDRTPDEATGQEHATGQEQARGRSADAPQEIPARGWKDVAKRVKDEARQDNITIVAAGVAFFALISVTPALAAMVSVYGLVATPEDVARRLNDLATAIPEDARSVLDTQLTQVVSGNKGGLTLGVLGGIAIALWGASTAMKHLIVALSAMYDESESRGYVKLRLRAAVLTVAGIVFLGVVMFLVAGVPAWAQGTGNDVPATVVNVVRWPVLLVLMLAALAVLYRYAPDRDEPRWRWVSWGAGIATALWIVASLAFSFYTANFGSYNKTYGAMAAIVILMLWLWITALCVLGGAEINAELERQTARDSTKGPEQPLGQRDAVVADTVASSS